MDAYMMWLTAISTFLAVTSVMMLVLNAVFRQDGQVSSRIEEMVGDEGEGHVGDRGRQDFSELPFLKTSYEASQRVGMRQRLQEYLSRGGLRTPVQKRNYLVWVATVAMLISLAVIAILLVWDVPAYFVAMNVLIVWGVVSVCFLRSLEQRHQRHLLRMVNSLADFMDLLVICLESGLSLDSSLRRVTLELEMAHPELAYEMKHLQKEIELGTTLEQAFYRLAERTGLETVSTMACFIEQSRKFGTSISEALREHADMLRLKRETRAEEMAQKASMKILLPTLLLIFPATFVVLAGPAVMEVTTAFEQSTGSLPE